MNNHVVMAVTYAFKNLLHTVAEIIRRDERAVTHVLTFVNRTHQPKHSGGEHTLEQDSESKLYN